MVGKGHLGYITTDHLPVNRGFDTHVGVRSPSQPLLPAEFRSLIRGGCLRSTSRQLRTTTGATWAVRARSTASSTPPPAKRTCGTTNSPATTSSTRSSVRSHHQIRFCRVVFPWRRLRVCGRGVPDSANYYTSRAIALIEGRDKSKPFYLHQTYQSVHVTALFPLYDPPCKNRLLVFLVD